MRIQFGTGNVFFVPLTAGNPAVPSSPRQPATMQDFNFDNSATIKELRGQYQYPDDTAISDKKGSWKMGNGRFDADLFNNLFGGQVEDTGGEAITVSEAHNTPSTNPHTVTVTNAADFNTDLGVTYADTGQPFARVASGPTEGEYAVSPSGVYTFAAADSGVAVLISYSYDVTTGSIVQVTNQIQGYGPSFMVYVAESYQELTAGVPNYLKLYACKASKFSFPLKRADYLISDIEGEAYANAAGNVFDLYED